MVTALNGNDLHGGTGIDILDASYSSKDILDGGLGDDFLFGFGNDDVFSDFNGDNQYFVNNREIENPIGIRPPRVF